VRVTDERTLSRIAYADGDLEKFLEQFAALFEVLLVEQ
jgi:hypothetical protein